MQPPRPDSTYRSLLPFTTVAPVRDAQYELSLPRHSVYKNFAARVDAYDRHPEKEPAWGVFLPAEFLHDLESPTMPRTELMLGPRGMKPILSEGFAQYTSAMLFYDHLVRLAAVKVLEGNVLRHPRQLGWIGREKVIIALQDTTALLETFIANTQAPTALQNHQEAPGAANASLSLATQIVLAGSAKKFYANVKNLAAVAFSISIVTKGYMQVPDNYQDIDCSSSTTPLSSDVMQVMTNVKRIRAIFLVAVGISPLAILAPFDLSTAKIDIGHMILNCHRLGNHRPPALRKFEDEFWKVVVLPVAEGQMTPVQALLNFKSWVTQKPPTFTESDRTFYHPGEILNWSQSMSVYHALPSKPYARHWPLPPAAHHAIAVAQEVADRKAVEDVEMRKHAEEEMARAAEEGAARKHAEEEEARKRAEEEVARVAEEEARKRAEEEVARVAEEEARKRAEEEVARVAEEEAMKRAEEEAARKCAEEARKRAEEEAARVMEEAVRKRAEDEAARVMEEAVRKRAEDEAARVMEEAVRKRAEEEAARVMEEAVRKRAEEEAARVAEEEARKRAEEEGARAAQARKETEEDEDEDEARQVAEDEAAAKKMADELARLLTEKANAEEAERVEAEAAAARAQVAAEAARVKKAAAEVARAKKAAAEATRAEKAAVEAELLS